MCGRFARTDYLNIIAEQYSIDEIYSDLQPSYNIAPGDNIAAVTAENNKNIIREFKWGLVPYWAKNPSLGNKVINARSETITEKASFKRAFKSRRCLIIANGFYEWEKKGSVKQPVYIYPKTETFFAFAGLYDKWVSPEGKELNTCTIITTDANELLLPIHDRMPVIITRDNNEVWLQSEKYEAPEVLPLLKSHPSEEMKWHYVDMAVNSPKNNSPECIVQISG